MKNFLVQISNNNINIRIDSKLFYDINLNNSFWIQYASLMLFLEKLISRMLKTNRGINTMVSPYKMINSQSVDDVGRIILAHIFESTAT